MALTAGESGTAGQSSIPAVERSPIIQRLQLVMRTMNGHVISSGPQELAKFAFLINALTEEIIEELEDKDDERIGAMMQVMGEVLAWIGHGDDERLPELVRGFASQAEPKLAELEASEV